MKKTVILISIFMSSLLLANASNDNLKNFDDKKDLFEHNEIRVKTPHKRKIKINPICVTIEYQQAEEVTKIRYLKAEKTSLRGMGVNCDKMLNSTQNTDNSIPSNNINIIPTIGTIDAIKTEEDSIDIDDSCRNNNNVDQYAIQYVEDSLSVES